MKKINLLLLLFLILFLVGGVSAHVVVKPAQVGIGSFQTFTMGVPVEKDIPTTGLRLVIPEGLNYVTPNVKQGWKIEVKKTGTGEDAKVIEITWTGGSIPAGQRDEFLFSAKVPATETSLNWKAYQTYSDGMVVAWDHDPAAAKSDDDESLPPYSVTKVINDLVVTSAPMTPQMDESQGRTHQKTDTAVAYVALALGAVALALSLRKR